jgi:predicted GTPase
LLGRVGHGKTSFLNYLLNVENGVKSVKDMESCKKFNVKELENYDGGAMASKTSDCSKYKCKIGEANLTIIDTPGFGDSRGVKLDDESINKICDFVLKEKGINCIVIVQNGREGRFTSSSKYGYSRLMSILPKEISRQIVMVYTNCNT